MGISVPVQRPIDRPLPRDMTGRGPGGGGGSYPADLGFYALDTQNGSFVADVIVGVGSITEAATSTRYYPDASNVWQAFGSGVVGRYYHDGDWWYPFHAGWTNSVTFSTDLTNAAWTKTNATAAKTQTGLRGDANGASLLTATAGNGTCILASAVTAASNPHGTRWFLKRSVGTGTVEITLDNGSTWTDVTTALAAASGWYEAVAQQTVANPQIGIRLVTSGDAVIVGNAELAVDPTVSSETASGILRGNSPIFTSGSTGSVDQTTITVDGANQDGSKALYYAECVTLSADADYGLTDIYFPSFSATEADAAAVNFANGNVWSSQYLQPAAGGSTTQVTRSVVAGDRLQVASWYNAAESSANFSLAGDLASGATPFSSFFSDGSMHLIRLQGATLAGVILLRNMRRYTMANMAAGQQLALDLINGTQAWGQNIIALSTRMDLYTSSNNPWTATGATCSRNAVGLDGVANTAFTITDPDASLRIFRQSGIPMVADTTNYAIRFFIKKDTDTTRFPEINLQFSGGTLQNIYVQINTQTGAIVSRTGPSVFTAQTSPYNSAWWEVVGEMANNGTNTSGNLLIYPAFASTLGAASSAALTGSIIIGNVELYRGVTAASVLGQDPAYTPQTKAPEVNPS